MRDAEVYSRVTLYVHFWHSNNKPSFLFVISRLLHRKDGTGAQLVFQFGGSDADDEDDEKKKGSEDSQGEGETGTHDSVCVF